MHINWNTRVAVPALDEPRYSQSLREHIREATDDDLLAAFLYHAEGRTLMTLYARVHNYRQAVQREATHAQRLAVSDQQIPTRRAFQDAYRHLRELLADELSQAQRRQNAVAEIWHGLRDKAWTDLSARYRTDTPVVAELEEAGHLESEVSAAQLRLSTILREHSERIQTLALSEADYLAFATTTDSFSTSDLDTMSPAEFEQVIATLAARDGLTVERRQGGARDLGADVIALTPDQRKIVFQCKHRRTRKKIGSDVIQTLNGTARPVHGADIVVAVSNSTFTQPAHDLANAQGIHLLFGQRLEHWATWGVPLLRLLGEQPDTEQAVA
ncbi:restriction endonuclease [Kitasatospora sp. NPDC101157]|uniref:restriction endonuclease n=1 Tax=Kitasatospora sp. NPDC101157 TaxID=3364098 RepID=UPI003802BBFA